MQLAIGKCGGGSGRNEAAGPRECDGMRWNELRLWLFLKRKPPVGWFISGPFPPSLFWRLSVFGGWLKGKPTGNIRTLFFGAPSFSSGSFARVPRLPGFHLLTKKWNPEGGSFSQKPKPNRPFLCGFSHF